MDVLPQYNGAQTEPLPLTSLKPFSYISYYSQPSVSAGSSTMESTNYRQKIPKRSKTQGLILLCSGNYLHYIYNYLHSIYTVLGIVSNLEVIQLIQDDACRLSWKYYAVLYMRLERPGIWGPTGQRVGAGILEPIPRGYRGMTVLY